MSIIDLAEGHQPMASEDGAILAVQNGEIYNFRDLRTELIDRGHHFRTRNDTEVLPHAYEEWGDALVPRLRGMFAIAIWDDRTRRLLLARDRFGKKPLVYALLPGGDLAFASEIQALLRHPAVSREVDESAIEAYLALGHVPAPLSAFSAIRKVPPAHVLTFDTGRIAVSRYWRLDPTPKLRLSMNEAADELRGRIDEAVRARLVSDVPIGVFLSGGLDSSSVVAFMSRHTERVRTFSVGFEDTRLNELPYARAVAEAFHTDHEELTVGPHQVDVLPMLLRHVGEPFADSSIVPTYHVARITRPHVTVVLTGDGGDELFLGYDRYRAALVGNWVTARVGAAARAMARIGAAVPTGHVVPRQVERIARFMDGLGVTGSDRYLHWAGYFIGDLRETVVGDRLRLLHGGRDFAAAAYRNGDIPSEAERHALADLELGLPGDLLVKMDIATMAASLEARSPLLDHDLAEFVARLPVEYKISPRRSKIVLRHAMRAILPRAVLTRGKGGFVAPAHRWLRGPLRAMLSDLALDGEAVRRGWVDRSGAARAYRDHMSGRADRTRHLWSLLALEIWCREMDAVRPQTTA